MSEEVIEVGSIQLAKTIQEAAADNREAAKTAEKNALVVESLLSGGGGGGEPVDVSPYLVAWELPKDEEITLEIPKEVKRIRDRLFNGAQIIGTLTIPQGVEYVGVQAFEETRISRLEVPDSVKEIDAWAFSMCSDLKTVFFSGNSSITKIRQGCFGGSGLETFNIPDSVEEIEPYAFENSADLRVVTFGKSLLKIGQGAFSGTNINHAILPSSLTEIDEAAFSYCGNLESLDNFENTQVSVIKDEAFAFCEKLQTVKCPSTLTRIGPYAFQGATLLGNIYLNEGLLEIDGHAFDSCPSLRTVIIPKTTLALAHYAFPDCSNLERLSLPGASCTIGRYALNYCPATCNITTDMTLAELTTLRIPVTAWGVEPGAVIHCVDGDYTIPEA